MEGEIFWGGGIVVVMVVLGTWRLGTGGAAVEGGGGGREVDGDGAEGRVGCWWI